MPDRLEAGTYLLAGAITKGDVTVDCVVPDHLRSVTANLAEAGARIEEGDHHVRVIVDQPLIAVDVHTYFYPGFPTDLQQPFSALLTQALGESVVQETVFEARMAYAYELQRRGADARVNGSTAVVNGPCQLRGTTVTAHDLRAGAAVMLAALIRTPLCRPELIDVRGQLAAGQCSPLAGVEPDAEAGAPTLEVELRGRKLHKPPLHDVSIGRTAAALLV